MNTGVLAATGALGVGSSLRRSTAGVYHRTESPRRRGSHGEFGFTLVELLIALVLIAIIMLLMFSGLRLGSRAWEGIERVTERVDDVRMARNVIDRILRQARDVRLAVDGVERLVFAGDQHSLELVAPLSEHVGVSGLYVIRFVLEEAGDDQRLVLMRWLLHPEVLEGGDDYPAWEPLLDGPAIAADPGPLDQDLAAGAFGRTVLLPRVGDFQLAYFDVAEGEQDAGWLDEWVDQPHLPRKIRYALTSPAQSWPEATITLPGGEVYDDALQ